MQNTFVKCHFVLQELCLVQQLKGKKIVPLTAAVVALKYSQSCCEHCILIRVRVKELCIPTSSHGYRVYGQYPRFLVSLSTLSNQDRLRKEAVMSACECVGSRIPVFWYLDQQWQNKESYHF